MKDQSSEKYTCPMHSQVVQDKPGTCPICGMTLVLQKKNANAAVLDHQHCSNPAIGSHNDHYWAVCQIFLSIFYFIIQPYSVLCIDTTNTVAITHQYKYC